MIKTVNKVLGLCFILLVVSCKKKAEKSTDAYVLKGHIENIADGTTVKLLPGATHSNEKAVAETTVENGEFSFSGKLEEPRLFYVVFGDNQGFINAVLENAEISLSAKAGDLDEESGRIVFSDEIITGSEAHDYYREQIAFKEELEQDYADYHKGYEELSRLLGKARGDNDDKLMDSLLNTSEYKEFEQKEKAFFEKVEKKSTDLILGHKDSWWGPLFMLTQYAYFTPEQRPIFEQFSEEAKNSYYGQLLHEELFPKGMKGEKVADFNLKDKDGKSVQTTSVFAGKKYILIDFWASWCAPCRKEIPNLKKAYEEFSGKGFEILSVSIDQKHDAWLKALADENMPWPNLIDDGSMSDAFAVKAIPATFLVDESGTVIAENLRGEALDEKLKELLP